MPEFSEACTIGEGIVPVPQVPGDGRQVIEAYVEGSSYDGYSSGGSSYLLN